jgi:hypothetical protein
MKEPLSNLNNGISEVFDIYNIKNPIKEDVNQTLSVPNPLTGDLCNATLNYRTIEIKGDIQEIHLRMTFVKALRDLVGNDSLSEKSNGLDPSDFASITKYYFNTKTTWPELIEQKMHLSTDTLEIKTETKSKAYK